jgi:hypothetical protein
MSPDQFPQLLAAVRREERFVRAVELVASAVVEGSIRNVVLADTKHYLSGVIHDGWRKHVQEPYFYAGKYEEHPSEVRDLNHRLMVSGLHGLISANRKLGKTKATGPAVDAMRSFVSEALPLAEAVASLKDKVVKGRAPNTGESRPENPNKIVRTCPVCFRQIAVVRETMAHHGYERPGFGSQTASCQGIRFKPLEVSSEGLAWLVACLEATLAGLEKSYATRDEKDSLLVRVGQSYESITKESPKWAREFRFYVSHLEGEIGSLHRELPRLQKMLREWKPGKQSL